MGSVGVEYIVIGITVCLLFIFLVGFGTTHCFFQYRVQYNSVINLGAFIICHVGSNSELIVSKINSTELNFTAKL